MDETSAETRLRVAQVVDRTEAEGPGRRFAIWLQGCPLRCPGCCNPQMLSFEGGEDLAVAGLADRIGEASARHGVEGITLLGGEPFAQAGGAASLARRARSMGLSVMVFSGYTIEEIRASPDPSAAALLGWTDLLVDGPYLRDQPETRRRWVGSANQRVHALTDRYRVDDPCWDRPNTLEIRLAGPVVTVNGFPQPFGRRALEAAGRPSGKSSMTTVRPFEADLLRLLHAILGEAPVEGVVGVLTARRPRPKCLGEPALRLIRDALALGCVRRLARGGGWLAERHLRGDRVGSGRLWERTPPEDLGLVFSGQALEFLIRLVADEPSGWGPPTDRGTLGDRVLIFLAYRAFRETPVGLAWPKEAWFRGHGLCRLAFPADFAGIPELDLSELAGWVEPADAWVLESLQYFLTRSWVEAGQSRAGLDTPGRVLAIGEEEARVAAGFVSALEAAGRPDLARFLLAVARELLGPGHSPSRWVRSPEWKGLALEYRARVARASLSPLETLDRLRNWERAARGVGFFDEGYAAAQLWKSDWERAGGEGLWEQARSLLRAADPLARPG